MIAIKIWNKHHSAKISNYIKMLTIHTHIHVHMHRPNTQCYNLVASSLFSTNLNLSVVSPSSCWLLVFFLFLRL